jgi:hypothetical protein
MTQAAASHNAEAYVFTPPANIVVDDGDAGFKIINRDPTKHYVEQVPAPSSTDKYKYYLVSVEDADMSNIQIREDGALYFKGRPVSYQNRSTLHNFSALRAVCHASEYAAQAAEVQKQQEHRHGENKRTRNGSLITAKVREPRHFDGTSKDPATDISIWLWEIKDYLDITNVPETHKATYACSFLTGQARSSYVIRRTYAAETDPSFVHSMAFLESTLRAMYVPLSQGCVLYKRLYTGDGWLLPFDKQWNPSSAITSYELVLNMVLAHGLVVDPIGKVQIFLNLLPPPVYEALKLNPENKIQTDWEAFKTQCDRVADEVRSKYLEWLSPRPRVATASQPSSTTGVLLNHQHVATGDQANEPLRSGCPICRSPDHCLQDCPFFNTNINNRFTGFNKSLQTQVRDDPANFLSDGRPNSTFAASGGLVLK